MKTLGEILLEARLRLGLSLIDCVEFTRISKRAIRHMENDEWNRLHDRATVERLLKIYAGFLRLNVAAVLHQFNVDYPEEELIFEEDPEEKAERLAREAALKKKKLRLNLFLLAFVAIVAFFSTLLYRYFQEEDLPGEEPPLTGEADLQEEGEQESLPSLETDSGAAAFSSGRSDLDLELRGLSDCWVSISADGQKEKEGLMTEGQIYTLRKVEELSLELGSAGGVEVRLNGVLLEPLGDVGQVVRKRYRMEEGTLVDVSTNKPPQAALN